jgi:hypothetical protein
MKKYDTKEECLKVNGEHAWHEVIDNSGMSCLVYHTDGYCSNNDPLKQCYHCPARKIYTRVQPATFEWQEI